MKSNAEPTTNRIERLLEVLSSYTFNLYYLIDKDIALGDFPLSIEGGMCDLYNLIPSNV